MPVKLIKYELYDLIKSKWLLGIFFFYLSVVYAFLDFGKDATKAIISHNNLALITLPLFSLLLSTTYFYNNKNFISFVLTQPIKRLWLFLSIFISLSLSLIIGFLLGSFLPFYYLLGIDYTYIRVLLLNAFVIPIFTSLGILLALIEEDRLKGVGLALLVWLIFSALYDGLLLYIIILFSDYPIEKFVIFLTLLNPIDLIRLTTLMDTGLHEIIGFVGKWLLKYSDKLFMFSALLSSFYSLLFLSLGSLVFRKKDF